MNELNLGALLTGQRTLMVGLEDTTIDGAPALKVYVGSRWKGVYVIVDDPAEMAKARRAWSGGGHVFMAIPPADHLCRDEPPHTDRVEEQTP